MALLTREDILRVDDLQRELVEVPEWGGEVWVYGLTGAERDAFEASIIGEKKRNDKNNYQNLRARFISLALRDENGKRLFASRDIEALGQKSCAALQRVYDVAQRLSGLSDEDAEELAGNSESGPSAASTSD